MKRSAGKATLPGRKQVYRVEKSGVPVHDLIALEEEPPPPGGRPLLELVMAAGRRLAGPTALSELRARREAAAAALPAWLKALDVSAQPYEVRVSSRLRALAKSQKA